MEEVYSTTNICDSLPVKKLEASENITIDANCNQNVDSQSEEIKLETELIHSADCDSKVSEEIKGETFEEPCFQFNQVPLQITGAWGEFKYPFGNHTRGCKWSPDGSCILTNSDDAKLRLFNLPNEFYKSEFEWDNLQEMRSVLQVKNGTMVFDFAWYPLMTSTDPVTCCFASCSAGNPVHLWDAFTGELRCTYRPYDHVDEVVSPLSLGFNTSGQKLYCGSNKMVRIFDIGMPGRHCIERPTYVKKCGLPGIISCFAFSPVNEGISVAGSYYNAIGIFSEPDGTLEHLLKANSKGVTHVQFSPDGTKLYSGGRNDPDILCWDLRNLGTILYSMRRVCVTGQRVYFDISRCGQYLISGSTNGIITIWDTTKEPKNVPQLKHPVLEPIQYYQAHSDCVNGISIHPSLPLIATSSGMRKFPEPIDDESEKMFSYISIQRDNSLRLWWFNSV